MSGVVQSVPSLSLQKQTCNPSRLHLFLGKFFVLSVFFSPFAKTRVWWNSLSTGPFPAAQLFQEGGVQSYWRGRRASNADHPPSVLSWSDQSPPSPPQPCGQQKCEACVRSLKKFLPCLICFFRTSHLAQALSLKTRQPHPASQLGGRSGLRLGPWAGDSVLPLLVEGPTLSRGQAAASTPEKLGASCPETPPLAGQLWTGSEYSVSIPVFPGSPKPEGFHCLQNLRAAEQAKVAHYSLKLFPSAWSIGKSRIT